MSFAFRKKSLQSPLHRAFDFWYRWQGRVFFALFVVLLVWSGWQWYQDFYVYQWTDGQKDIYKNTKLKTTLFHEDAFQRTLDMVSRRQSGYVTVTGDDRDIFNAGN